MSAKRLTRTELIRALHHALNTPLVSISNLTEILLLGVEGVLSPVIRQDITDIADDVQRLRNVVADVLALVERDAPSLKFQYIDLAEALFHTSQTGFRCAVIKLPHEPLKVWGDQTALIQVMQKLVAQVECTQVEGDIAVCVSVADEQVRVSVSYEHLHATTPKMRLDDTSSIDLLFCYRVIEAHGGTLWLLEDMNQPLQFIISLPLTNTS